MPRGTCPVCGHDVALRGDGTVRKHRFNGNSWSDYCFGAGKQPRPMATFIQRDGDGVVLFEIKVPSDDEGRYDVPGFTVDWATMTIMVDRSDPPVIVRAIHPNVAVRWVTR